MKTSLHKRYYKAYQPYMLLDFHFLLAIREENLASEEGIKLMFKRSNEAEGTFDDMKTNQKYNRLLSRGESGVNLEIYLVAIGHNMRRYHRLIRKNKAKAEELITPFVN